MFEYCGHTRTGTLYEPAVILGEVLASYSTLFFFFACSSASIVSHHEEARVVVPIRGQARLESTVYSTDELSRKACPTCRHRATAPGNTPTKIEQHLALPHH